MTFRTEEFTALELGVRKAVSNDVDEGWQPQ